MSRGAILLVAVVAAACAEPEPPRPNVVLLVMDTTRADRCGFEGSDRAITPRLDEFARDAVVYLDAWSPAGWTAPAHASLFTSLRAEHHGLHAGNRLHLRADVPTLAELLAKAGYGTACFSNNDLVAPEFGLTRGFAKVEMGSARHRDRYPWATETHENAATWLEGEVRSGRPFFLFVNDMEPHMPYTPPPADQARLVRGSPSAEQIEAARRFDFTNALRYSLHAQDVSPGEIDLLSDLYDAEIASLDREIGSLLDRLRKDGLLDTTIVIVTSDHGELLGEHHRLEHGSSLHRAVRHVPLVVRAPGRLDGGRRVESVVRLEDLMPTVLELCRVDAPKLSDGASLLGDLTGRTSRAFDGSSNATRQRLQTMVPGLDVAPLARGMQAVYDGRWHYLEYGDGAIELFDLRADPSEEHELSRTHSGELARLAKLLHAR